MRKITNIEVDGIDTSDYPKFCDAYISSADWEDEDGTLTPLTEDELESLNDNNDLDICGLAMEECIDRADILMDAQRDGH